LNTPANGATDISLNTLLEWTGDENYDSYDVEIATDPGFSIIVESANVLFGTSTVSPQEIVVEVGHGMKDSDSKIKNLDVLAHLIAQERSRGKQVVFTNGCFDLLHVGHVKYLQKARGLGDLLVVGLNSDASVRRLKGEHRPLIEESERAHILAALDCIDYVVLFDEDTPLTVIEALVPAVLAKGADYKIEEVVGREVVEAGGGRVELVQFVDGRSTSRIIDKILASY
jgi:D-beta-D-heptose 7-phosphate kinase/D-beta-D-heptose 1-phosphate adenosyltransferase